MWYPTTDPELLAILNVCSIELTLKGTHIHHCRCGSAEEKQGDICGCSYFIYEQAGQIPLPLKAWICTACGYREYADYN